MKAYFDTAVLVAACLADHPHHIQAAASLHAVRARKTEAYISAHGLAEFYAVLTKPHSPHLFTPVRRGSYLATTYFRGTHLSRYPQKEYEENIRRCAQQGWSGGRVYDALHLRCAQKTESARIYTFNVRHFQQLAPQLANRITTP